MCGERRSGTATYFTTHADTVHRMGELMDGYIRVSRVAGRSGASYISPDVQREAIERWASYKQVEIGEWHVDEDWSGGTHRRPGLDRAIGRCLAGESHGIISWKIDRFSRSTEDGLRDLRRLEEAGARLVFAGEDIDTNGPMGKLVYTIMLGVASHYLHAIKAQWDITNGRAFERGAYITRTPVGYQREADGTITPHVVDGPLMREAFLMAGRQGVAAAARFLDGQLSVERVVTTATVRRMLSSRVYLGETDIKGFKGVTHEPIVSRAEWEAAQHDLAPRSDAKAFPLSGLLLCSGCGQPMVGGHGGVDSKLRVYRCSAAWTVARARSHKACVRGVVISAPRVEALVLMSARRRLSSLKVTRGDSDLDRRRELEQAVGDLAHDLDQFIVDTTLRRVLGDRYQAHLDAKMSALEMARGELRDFERTAHAQQTWDVDDLLNGEDNEALSTAARALFDAIVIGPGRGIRSEDRVTFVDLDDDGATWKAGDEEAAEAVLYARTASRGEH